MRPALHAAAGMDKTQELSLLGKEVGLLGVPPLIETNDTKF